MQPDTSRITLGDNQAKIREMLMELVLRPRRDLVKWASVTKQTSNMKIGYTGQHLASLVTGVEGTRTGARGHDLCDGSEVKSCSRVDQLDKCMSCKAAVSRMESMCPQCNSKRIKRNNDSKWLLSVKSQEELDFFLDTVPRIVFILSDYPHYNKQDWDTLQFQVFEIWPSSNYKRHKRFRELMERYYDRIYLQHIEQNPTKTPAPKNLWPYSFQFYICNPVRTFHCTVTNANTCPQINILDYTEPHANRAKIAPVRMPSSVLSDTELDLLKQHGVTVGNGLDEAQRSLLPLRNSDRASAHNRIYRRGDR